MSTAPETTALIVVDLQNDFCPGGALAVAGGDEIIPIVNRLMGEFSTVVLTQDWHPPNHASFAACHPGLAPFSSIAFPYGAQTLWPTHCVAGTKGAEFHPDLRTDRAHLIIRKGLRAAVDSYSAFLEADRAAHTGLDGYLKSRGIEDVVLCGLALDYCVAWSALDAVHFGFRASVLEEASRAIDLDGSREAALSSMRNQGVILSSA